MSGTAQQPPCAGADDRAILDFEARCRSRLLVTLESGAQAALVVERGRMLRDGDRVRLEDGRSVRVRCRTRPRMARVFSALECDWQRAPARALAWA
jgi:urease accessory protein UreE